MKKPKIKDKLKRKPKHKQQTMPKAALTQQNITDLLSAKRGPKVLWRDEQVLDSEELSNDKQEFVIEGKKIIMETTVIQSTVKYIKLREPGRYEEALDSFINKDGVQWKQH